MSRKMREIRSCALESCDADLLDLERNARGTDEAHCANIQKSISESRVYFLVRRVIAPPPSCLFPAAASQDQHGDCFKRTDAPATICASEA